MVPMNRAQQERAQTAFLAEHQKLARARQFNDGILNFAEMAVKPCFELRQRNVCDVTFVKPFEWQTKLRAKLVERQLGDASHAKHVIGRPPDGRQVIHERARPIENDVPNHALTLAEEDRPAIKKNSQPGRCPNSRPRRLRYGC